MKLYSIFDKEAENWTPLFEAENDIFALRMTINAFTQPFAEHFELYLIGNFDRNTGKITTDKKLVKKLFKEDKQ